MLNRLLDGLASRLGLAVSILAVVVVSTGAGFYFESTSGRLLDIQKRLDQARLRNGLVAISDIQRATLLLQAGLPAHELSSALREEFAAALDILYVRAGSFGRKTGEEEMENPALGLVQEAMFALVEEGDRVLASDAADFTRIANVYLDASDEARRMIVRYIDEQRRIENDVVRKKSEVLQEQRVFLMAITPALSATIIAALLLLRREVLSRKARDRAEKRVHFLAFYDPLTGLANRVQYQDRVGAWLADGKATAVMLVDLDDFKVINDTYGHSVGDLVLEHVARILSSAAGSANGFAARLGGDEFALFVPTEDPALLTALCETILAGVREPFVTDTDRFAIGASIGVAISSQVSSASTPDYEALSRVGDFALYASKLAGRGRYTFYDNELERQYLERRAMQEELPRAVEDGSLEVFLQPKYSFRSERVASFEALVRWRRNGAIVSPGAFIQIAEESGLIAEIDSFILSEATRLVAEWNREHGTEYGISVNLSAVSFSHPRLVERIETALGRSGLPAGLLTVEITETVEILDWERVQDVLCALRHVGCRISIDDFGTGYSSLAYVRAMEADELKIDRSLLREIEASNGARSVLETVIYLASNLGMDIVAEGVETTSQATVVRDIGVDLIQGYLIGAPIPAGEALPRAASIRLAPAPGAHRGADAISAREDPAGPLPLSAR